jgi:hypothetical protein
MNKDTENIYLTDVLCIMTSDRITKSILGENYFCRVSFFAFFLSGVVIFSGQWH